MVSGMNDCPPKPGSTVITRIWSKSSRRSNSPSTGVAGLTATPARAPIARSRRARATGSFAASRWKVTDAAPSSAYSGAQRSGSAIIRCTSSGIGLVAWMRSHHLRAEGQVGHEVVVHDVHVHEIGGGDAGEVGLHVHEVRGEHARVDPDAVRAVFAVHASIMVEPWTPSCRCCTACSKTPVPSAVGLRRATSRSSPTPTPSTSRSPSSVRADACGPSATMTRTFTIQSISKPFVLALALSDLGLDKVMERVGAEPSGEPFNAISLEAGHRAPLQSAWSTRARSPRPV